MADDVLAEPDPNEGLLQPVPGQKFGPDGPLGGDNPVGFTPQGVGDNLQSDPVVTKPGVVNSDASPNKPNASITDSAGTAGGKGPKGVNGSEAALPFMLDPGAHPGDGQLRREHPRRHRHLGVVPDAAAHSGPAAGRRRRLGRHLVVQGGRRLHVRPVAPIAVGRNETRRQRAAARADVPDRHRAAAGLAQPALPDELGATGGQRRAHRRLRPQPQRGPVVRVHAAAGAGD